MLHGVFAHAANMLCNGIVYALVDRENYDAPATMIVHEARLFGRLKKCAGTPVIRQGLVLRFESGDSIDGSCCRRSDSRIGELQWNKFAVVRGLDEYGAYVRECSAEISSLTFYKGIAGELSNSVSSSFGCLCTRLHEFMRSAQLRCFEGRAVCNLVGLGDGLTPSGDDFLCGFLCVSTSVAHPIAALWKEELRESLLSLPLDERTTLVGSSMLKSACKGMAASPYREFVASLMSGQGNLRANLDVLAGIGATSGLDFSVGAACAARLLLCEERRRACSCA